MSSKKVKYNPRKSASQNEATSASAGSKAFGFNSAKKEKLHRMALSMEAIEDVEDQSFNGKSSNLVRKRRDLDEDIDEFSSSSEDERKPARHPQSSSQKPFASSTYNVELPTSPTKITNIGQSSPRALRYLSPESQRIKNAKMKSPISTHLAKYSIHHMGTPPSKPSFLSSSVSSPASSKQKSLFQCTKDLEKRYINRVHRSSETELVQLSSIKVLDRFLSDIYLVEAEKNEEKCTVLLLKRSNTDVDNSSSLSLTLPLCKFTKNGHQVHIHPC
ncbi:hypothetical protein POMI540_3267 [Schizosaccharomyces pombe]